MAAPIATASSGFTSLRGSLPEEFAHQLPEQRGIRALAADEDHVGRSDVDSSAGVLQGLAAGFDRSLQSRSSTEAFELGARES